MKKAKSRLKRAKASGRVRNPELFTEGLSCRKLSQMRGPLNPNAQRKLDEKREEKYYERKRRFKQRQVEALQESSRDHYYR